MKLKFAILVFGAIVLLYLYGCGSIATVTQNVEELSAARLVNKLEANRRCLKNFEGAGTLAVKTSQFDNDASFHIVIIKPDTVFLEVFGPFGIELAQILVTENDFTFYQSLSNTAYTGTVSDTVLKEIFKVSFPLSQIIDAFIGSVNLSERLYKEPTFFDRVENKYYLTYRDSLDHRQARYEIDMKDLGLLSYRLETLDQRIILNGLYSDFEVLDGLPIPKSISFSNEKDGQTVTITYKNVAVNKKPLTIDFSIPEDADIIKW